MLRIIFKNYTLPKKGTVILAYNCDTGEFYVNNGNKYSLTVNSLKLTVSISSFLDTVNITANIKKKTKVHVINGLFYKTIQEGAIIKIPNELESKFLEDFKLIKREELKSTTV